jgi:hypothetical protein
LLDHSGLRRADAAARPDLQAALAANRIAAAPPGERIGVAFDGIASAPAWLLPTIPRPGRLTRMKLQDLYVSQAPRYALSRDARTNAPIFSIPVSNTLVDYLEYYRIAEDELALFLADPEAAAAFARRCGNRELDDRLVLKPGTDRGFY